MRQLFGFVLLVAVALLLLTVISGIGGVFGSIAATWTVDQTAEIASGLSEVLWLGGIVFVMTLGYGLFVNMTKGGRGWSGGRAPQQVEPTSYYIDAQPQQPTLLPPPTEPQSWYALEQNTHDNVYKN